MFYCEKCGSADACERTDLVNEPVLCDKCYSEEIYGEWNVIVITAIIVTILAIKCYARLKNAVLYMMFN